MGIKARHRTANSRAVVFLFGAIFVVIVLGVIEKLIKSNEGLDVKQMLIGSEGTLESAVQRDGLLKIEKHLVRPVHPIQDILVCRISTYDVVLIW